MLLTGNKKLQAVPVAIKVLFFISFGRFSNQARLIRPNMIAIIAITNKIWIKPETLYTKKPSSQPIIKITAMI